jgi:hypothetical protein
MPQRRLAAAASSSLNRPAAARAASAWAVPGHSAALKVVICAAAPGSVPSTRCPAGRQLGHLLEAERRRRAPPAAHRHAGWGLHQARASVSRCPSARTAPAGGAARAGGVADGRRGQHGLAQRGLGGDVGRGTPARTATATAERTRSTRLGQHMAGCEQLADRVGSQADEVEALARLPRAGRRRRRPRIRCATAGPPARVAARPARPAAGGWPSTRCLHGPRDRGGDGLAGSGLAGTRRARARGAHRPADGRAGAAAGHGGGRHRRRHRLPGPAHGARGGADGPRGRRRCAATDGAHAAAAGRPAAAHQPAALAGRGAGRAPARRPTGPGGARRRLPRAGLALGGAAERAAGTEAGRPAGAGRVQGRGRLRADQAAAQDERGPGAARGRAARRGVGAHRRSLPWQHAVVFRKPR